jgi:polysaccharide biosynthesis protein PslH
MRILFLAQLLPFPLDAGPKVRSHYVLRHLAAAGHEVSLLCFIRPEDRQEHIQSLSQLCHSINVVKIARSRFKDVRDGFRSLLSPTPFLILRDQIREMYQRVEQVTGSRSFDAVHVDQLWMASYGLCGAGPDFRVLDQHNAVFQIPLQMAHNVRNPLLRTILNRESAKLGAFERQTCRHFNKVVWVSEEDKRALIPIPGDRERDHPVIPIAIDPGAQLPVPNAKSFRITMLGGMHWPPNSEGISWFAERIWPRIAAAIPDAVLTIVGKNPPTALARTVHGSRTEITGYVSNLQDLLSETAVFIVPLKTGAGMRVKILDAWCWGLPVVSTSIGAQGMHAVAGENLLIADDEDSFARCVVMIFRDSNLARRLREGGRATVEAFYDWRKAYQAWDQIYQ